MSQVDPAVTGAGITAIFTTVIMYVVDWIADQRERRDRIRLNGQKGEG